LFRKHKISADAVRTLEDLFRIPTTSKEDLQKYNDDFLCVPKNKIVDFVTTSGTLGEPVTIGLIDADLDRWSIGTDEIRIKIATKTPSEELLQTIKNHFRSKLRVTPGIEFVPTEQVQKLRMSKLGRKPFA
jgi:phenylacetate-CoA ligase